MPCFLPSPLLWLACWLAEPSPALLSSHPDLIPSLLLLHRRLYRFTLYWWWFVGLAVLCMAAVGTLVLPLPAGWAVRKQLARALRQVRRHWLMLAGAVGTDGLRARRSPLGARAPNLPCACAGGPSARGHCAAGHL